MDTFKAVDYDALRLEIRSLVQFSEKRYLTDISWEITDKPKHATKYDDDVFRPLTEEEWNGMRLNIQIITQHTLLFLSRGSGM